MENILKSAKEILNLSYKYPLIQGDIKVFMVQPTGLEPVTSSFAGRRSNPTELRLHDFRCERIV